MAATPPNSAPHPDEPRQPTALSAVFRRLGGTAPRPIVPSLPPARKLRRPEPAAASRPQLLGFAEPVTKVPPVEAFLPTEAETAAVVADRVEFAALEPAAPLEPDTPIEPEAVPEPEPAAVLAPARELPATQAVPPGRSHTVVGRLNRRPSEPSAARPEPGMRRPVQPPTEALDPAGMVSPSGPDRSGRPSLPRNRRRYRRAKLPAEIEIDGVPCTLIDVSIGGFAATGVPRLEPNALVPVTIRLLIDGIEVGTELTARIIYVTQGRSSGRFVELSPSQMAFLRYIVTWRGESVGAVGTTTLLDAISGGAERGFAAGMGERGDAPKSRWWAGLVGKKVSPPR